MLPRMLGVFQAAEKVFTKPWMSNDAVAAALTNPLLSNDDVQPPWPLVQRQEEEGPLDDATSVRFWRNDRDLAAVVFYIRKLGAGSIEYLISPSMYSDATNRSWNQGEAMITQQTFWFSVIFWRFLSRLQDTGRFGSKENIPVRIDSPYIRRPYSENLLW